MTPTPIYRVVSMEAGDYRNLYNHEIAVQLIPEDEIHDLSKGRVSEDGYVPSPSLRVSVTEEVFHQLRVGMVYQVAFTPAQLPGVPA